MSRLDATDVAKALELWKEGQIIRDNALRESEQSGKVPSPETMSQMDKLAETIRWLLRDADPNIAKWEPWGDWWTRPTGFDVRKQSLVVLKSAEPIVWKAIQDQDAKTLAWFARVIAELEVGESRTPADPAADDGPLPGNRFQHAGQIHDMNHVPWKLLSALWGHGERNMHDVEEETWGVAGGSQLQDALHDLKVFLERIGYPRYVSKPRRSDFLVWKAF